MRIVELFAGPGGWSEGLRELGLTDIGIEWDQAACATRAAAGHLTIRADVEHYPPERFIGFDGLIASPPCPDFSAAGKRAGRAGDSGRLVDIVPRWVDVIRPRWIACEQVPEVLPIWREHAHLYRQWGYSVECAILNAADYGVPQTRRRAILVARADEPALLPEPTHSRTPVESLFGPSLEPWVSMADALGWGMTARPCVTVTGGGTRSGGAEPIARGGRDALMTASEGGGVVRTRGNSGRPQDEFDPHAQPSRTLTGKSDSWERARG